MTPIRTPLLSLLIVFGTPASADESSHANPIEVVCDHAMTQTMDIHEYEFVAELITEIGEDETLAWMIPSTRALWLAELNRQCIEGLIPLRRQLVEADVDAAYQVFANCVLETTETTAMESCFEDIYTALIRTPSGSSERIQLHVNEIRDAMLRYGLATEEYPEIPAYVPDDAPGTEPRAWPEGSPFQVLGWAPEDGQAWGSYRVESIDEDNFQVYGMVDIDGDGVPAIWTATKRLEATRQTDSSIH